MILDEAGLRAPPVPTQPSVLPFDEPQLAIAAKQVRLDIRPCEMSDALALFDLFSTDDYRRAALPLPFASAEAVADWLRANKGRSFQIAALVAGSLIGFAGLYPLQGRQSHAGFLTIGIHPDHQSCGIGKKLLQLILATADTLAGLRRLELTVLADNARAIGLYSRFGFAIEGRHACFVQDGPGYVDGLTMARIKDAAPV